MFLSVTSAMFPEQLAARRGALLDIQPPHHHSPLRPAHLHVSVSADWHPCPAKAFLCSFILAAQPSCALGDFSGRPVPSSQLPSCHSPPTARPQRLVSCLLSPVPSPVAALQAARSFRGWRYTACHAPYVFPLAAAPSPWWPESPDTQMHAGARM
ncbi:uncharacterized protein PAN0_018c5591 [Moesziomyces antarcticus]|uniref:Uncharacterized protein n=2 Tax=Pseudozyma antarctica TaxID=84753 RepID=A0A5C3FW15_PSEA2|nr:uncharacterized protein PAN0_018c5591 [Moesziomyces antarcticus]GAK67364.1 hypothetical protein PAN0_018c5591 [Moesziomyces antarcticus]SPO48613.1 uncharacterized protein PSANT_06304 [Moesziomyces antarcticus]